MQKNKTMLQVNTLKLNIVHLVQVLYKFILLIVAKMTRKQYTKYFFENFFFLSLIKSTSFLKDKKV